MLELSQCLKIRLRIFTFRNFSVNVPEHGFYLRTLQIVHRAKETIGGIDIIGKFTTIHTRTTQYDRILRTEEISFNLIYRY